MDQYCKDAIPWILRFFNFGLISSGFCPPDVAPPSALRVVLRLKGRGAVLQALRRQGLDPYLWVRAGHALRTAIDFSDIQQRSR